MSNFDHLLDKRCSVCGKLIHERIWWEKIKRFSGIEEQATEYVHLECMANHPKFKGEDE